ncbi:MAG TPA: hypothetical protein VM890_06995 [Longimicrobium sp.]|nr:hypothetical protein [Longimicrobium sp.]
MRRLPVSPWLVLLLVVAIHVDWHAARPSLHHDRLSFDLERHWLLAVPVFALAAAWVRRRWPGRLLAASAANLGLAAVVAQVLEPLGEQAWYFHRFGLGIVPARWTAFLAFMAVGIATYVLTLAVLHRRAAARAPDSPVAQAL